MVAYANGASSFPIDFPVAGERKVRQHGVSKRRTWRKVHVGIDRATQRVIAAVVTTNDVADDDAFGDVLDQVPDTIDQVIGDGAHDKKKCYGAINQRQA